LSLLARPMRLYGAAVEADDQGLKP
jgi:hypothetical protein